MVEDKYCLDNGRPSINPVIYTIEQLFGIVKEHHGLRYTQMIGKAKMEMKVGLTFACLNLKKLAKILDKNKEYTATTFQVILRYKIFYCPFLRSGLFYTPSRLTLM